MNKAGSIISLIGGLFAVFAGFATLMAGGIGAAFHADGAQTVGLLGWGGIFYSFFVIIFASMALGVNSWIVSLLLVVSSILGIALGGGFVAIFMGLSLVGGLLSLISKFTSDNTNKPKLNLGIKIVLIILTIFLVIISASLIDQLIASKTSLINAQQTSIDNTTKTADNNVKEDTIECKSFTSNLKQTNLFITAIDNAKAFDAGVYDNAFPGQSGKSLLVPSYPGNLILTCVADIYYSNSSSNQLVYTVSKLDDGSIHIETKDNSVILPTLNVAIEIKKIQDEKDKVAKETAEKEKTIVVDSATDEETKANAESKPSIKTSFDCTKAKTKVENLICNDEELASLDNQLSKEFEQMKSNVNSTTLKQDQFRWLHIRNACNDKKCIMDSYKLRLTELASESE